jgi:hypothetical protein
LLDNIGLPRELVLYRLDAKSAIVWSGPIETERTGQSSDQAFAVGPPADSA